METVVKTGSLEQLDSSQFVALSALPWFSWRRKRKASIDPHRQAADVPEPRYLFVCFLITILILMILF